MLCGPGIKTFSIFHHEYFFTWLPVQAASGDGPARFDLAPSSTTLTSLT